MAIKYARLFDPVNQFVRKDGIPNAGGTLNIFYEGTDDRAELRDEDGTVLSNPLSLDADGRALGTFVDSARVYRLEVRDAYGAEQFTVRKMVPCGGGTGSTLGKEYNVVSGDGTVKVTSYVDAGVITFDLSTSYDLEGARWGAKLSLLDHIAEAGEWQELQAVSAQGSIPYVSGWYPGHAGAFDLAGSVEMVQGVPTAIHTVDVMAALVVGGVQKEVQHGIIDPSLQEQRVSFEFKGETEGEETVDVLYYVRSSETMSIGLAARTWYNDEVDGIVGGGGGSVGYSAGEGIHIDSANVISVTGMLRESASSQFAPSGDYAYNSSLSGYQPTGDYAYNSSLSSKLDASASSQFQPSGDYADASALSSKLDASASSQFQPSGDYALESSVSSKLDASASSQFAPSGDYAYNSSLTAYQPTGDYAYNSSLSSKLDASASSQFQPSGDYADASALSGKLDASASSQFAPSGDYAYNSSLTGYQPTGDYAYNSSLSSKLDASASSQFQPSGNYADSSALSSKLDASASSQFQPSGDYAYNSSLTGYQPTGDYAYNSSLSSKLDASASSQFQPSGNYQSALTFGYSGTAISSIDGSAIAGMGGGGSGKEYTGVYPVIVDNTADSISVDSTGLSIDETMSAYTSGGEVVIGVRAGQFAPTGDYAYNSAVSGKQDASAMTAYQDVAGMTAYQDVAGMSAYQPSGDYIYASALGIAEV